MGRRARCDGCDQAWSEVHAGPVLTDEVWSAICGQATNTLCDQCIRGRIMHVYHRPLQLNDMKPCPFNVGMGYFEELYKAHEQRWASR